MSSPRILLASTAAALAVGLCSTHIWAQSGSCSPTPSSTEGPYFTPNSPKRSSLLEATTKGTRLELSGRVLDTNCGPLAGVLVDFWQANADGQYDNRGYGFRGHQLTDAQGRYRLETVIPGEYTGRTEHIHVKVHAPSDARPDSSASLTTQLYFPGETSNDHDGIFRAALLMKLQRDPGGTAKGSFDFVIRP